jgi:hypothetical protein
MYVYPFAGPSMELRVSLLNLYISLECGAFVSSRGSPWGQLVDALRTTWAAKPKSRFVNVAGLGADQ